jgi:peroxiredoxin (alkyl hydroperoxide reductase subunit C)
MPAIQQRVAEFEAAGAQVLGLSVDSVPCHEAWANSLSGLGYPLLSDMHRAAVRAYGVLNPERNVARRATFVIDRGGIVRFAEAYPPGVLPDLDRILAEVQRLG